MRDGYYEVEDDVWAVVEPGAPCTDKRNIGGLLENIVPPGTHAGIVVLLSAIFKDETDHPWYGVYILEFDQMIWCTKSHMKPRDDNDGPSKKSGPGPPGDGTSDPRFDDDSNPNKIVSWDTGVWRPGRVRA